MTIMKWYNPGSTIKEGDTCLIVYPDGGRVIRKFTQDLRIDSSMENVQHFKLEDFIWPDEQCPYCNSGFLRFVMDGKNKLLVCGDCKNAIHAVKR